MGFGAGGRLFTLTGMVLMLIVMLMPPVADFLGRMGNDGFWDEGGRRLAEVGRDVLITGGLALWLLATYGTADLVRNRRAAA